MYKRIFTKENFKTLIAKTDASVLRNLWSDFCGRESFFFAIAIAIYIYINFNFEVHIAHFRNYEKMHEDRRTNCKLSEKMNK